MKAPETPKAKPKKPLARKTPSKRSGVAKAKPAAMDVALTVKGRRGFAEQRSMKQLKCDSEVISIQIDSEKLVKDEGNIWGLGRFTGEGVRTALVHLVAEGHGLRDALEVMRSSYPPMPSYLTVAKWKQMFPEFERAVKMSERLRGELQVEAATELVVKALNDEELDPRDVKNVVDQFRWNAGKLDREKFGDHKTVEVHQPMGEMSDDALDRRIKALMTDAGVRGVLESQGLKVIEAEVLPAEGEPCE